MDGPLDVFCDSKEVAGAVAVKLYSFHSRIIKSLNRRGYSLFQKSGGLFAGSLPFDPLSLQQLFPEQWLAQSSFTLPLKVFRCVREMIGLHKAKTRRDASDDDEVSRRGMSHNHGIAPSTTKRG